MSPKTEKQANGGIDKNRVSGHHGSKKINKYFEIIRENPDLPHSEAARRAGYSPKTDIQLIENTIQFQTLWEGHQRLLDSLMKPIEQRIVDAQARTGFCAELALKRIRQVIGTGKARDAVAAAKIGTEITGERLPERVDHNITGDDTLLSKLCSE